MHLSICFGLLVLLVCVSAGPTYEPLRPPALPLAVRTPYTSAWTSTANGDTLNSKGAIFWPVPDHFLGWEGIVTVDGISYEWLGTAREHLPNMCNFTKAKPLTVAYDSQYSNFTFAAGPVKITSSFFSPVLPRELCLTSIPLSYLTVFVESSDENSHDVSVYGDVNGNWLSNDEYKASAINWTLFKGHRPVNGGRKVKPNAVYTWLYGLQKPFEMAEAGDLPGSGDLPSWGNFSYSSRLGGAKNMTYGSGPSFDLRCKYIKHKRLNNFVDLDYHSAADRERVFAFAHDLGTIGPNATGARGNVTYTLGTIQQTVINYVSTSGVETLEPWWKRCYGDTFAMIGKHFIDLLPRSQELAWQWESQLKIDIDRYYSENGPIESPINGSVRIRTEGRSVLEGDDFDPTHQFGFLEPERRYAERGDMGMSAPGNQEKDAYYAIVALSARQIMGAYVLAIPPRGQDISNPLIFQKEISSNGNTNTADVIYPAMPFFLYANPEFLRLLLEPLYQNQENGFYPNDYAMHDLGIRFPNATGHVEGSDEFMPIESSGDMILMSLAYAKFSRDNSWLKAHYLKLRQWGQYLIDYSLYPTNQKSTDDFAGNLTDQVNLAIKGIIGIKAMAEIATLVGNTNDNAMFQGKSQEYVTKWENFSVDAEQKHTKLSYKWRGSYGLLYNTYPDLLLDLGVVPQRIHDMQSAWYPNISHEYGIPLDNRNIWTKSDWSLWAAATCSPSTRSLFVTSLAHWLNTTMTNHPFTDLYDTATGDFPFDPHGPNRFFFTARPVVGGHFSLLALGARKHIEDNASQVAVSQGNSA